ncbi:MAG TPA: glycoside hydrolase family 97 catalytic domain-containing protein [Verrucomicrobiae bacterium]|nr:glycoside hydrolase family 97 catalytic domain-containing protein [Verrucomicrobiae bacterium]
MMSVNVEWPGAQASIGTSLMKWTGKPGVLALALMVPLFAHAEAFRLKSPDGKVHVQVQTGSRLKYAVEFHGSTVVQPSALGVTVDGDDLGAQVSPAGKPEADEVRERYVTRGVHTNALNHYRWLTIPLAGGSGKTRWQLELRAYNDGVAYRYQVPGEGKRHIDGEASEWRIPEGTMFWHQSADNRSYEARYVPDIVGQSSSRHRLMAPATLKFAGNTGYGMMTEANLVRYSDMALHASGTNSFKAVLHDDPNGWDHTGEIVSPWRVTLLARDLNALVNSDLIRNLCPPPAPELAHAEWIKPGRSIWHWLTGGGPKLAEQKTWINGTRDMGYEYYLVDDGWRDWNGGGDNAWKALQELTVYAKSQNVGIWAWVHSKYVFKPEERVEYFKRAKDLGIAGLKIDFMEPANHVWVQWYEDVLRDAAKFQLMIDFHGCVKPTGRERTWPNEMTREGISGREQGKNPSPHDTTLPFLRYVQGHADYTPTLLNPRRLDGSSFAHELAMAIAYTSPYLCLGDNPTNYLNSAAVDVLKALPPVWDETIVLPGSEIGQIASLARRQGAQWFIGVINAQMPRREVVALDFLGAGQFKLIELADDSDRADAFVRTERVVTRKDKLTLPLRRDGGYVAWLVPMRK